MTARGRMRLQSLLLLVLGISTSTPAQVLMEGSRPGGPARLLPSDAAILDARQVRSDLPCDLKPVSPELGFDLGFHAGYEVALATRALVGDGNLLTAIFRVVPEGIQEEPTYFRQKWTVPPLEEDTKGTATLRGAFVVGEGDYRVDWLIRDRSEHFCTAFWRFSAARRGKDRPVALWVGPGTVKTAAPHPFLAESPINRDTSHPLSVLAVLHVAPQTEGASIMPPGETIALLSILRSIAREPRITSHSVIAFNIERNEVLYRQENASQIDFPALGAAIEQLHLGVVDFHKLVQKDRSDTQFIAEIVAEEIGRTRPDALIFIAPKGQGGDAAIRDSLKRLGAPEFPVFYLNYASGPPMPFWGDAIGAIVKLWKGAEYTIEKPRDLYLAWQAVISRIARKRVDDGGQVASDSSQPKNVDRSSFREHR